MLRTHDAEVAPIECGDRLDLEPLRGRDHGGIHRSKWQIAIGRHELPHPKPIRLVDHKGQQQTACQVTKEANLRRAAKPGGDQIGDLRDHENRNHERSRVCLQEGKALFVVRVIRVDVGIQRAGVDDQRDDCASA